MNSQKFESLIIEHPLTDPSEMDDRSRVENSMKALTPHLMEALADGSIDGKPHLHGYKEPSPHLVLTLQCVQNKMDEVRTKFEKILAAAWSGSDMSEFPTKIEDLKIRRR